MAFGAGRLDMLVRKHGTFGDYEVRGTWVCDDELKRGWLIYIEGLDKGSFAVSDGKIHRAGEEYRAGPGGETRVSIDLEIADLRASATQAIFDAIARWEAEERERPCE